MKRRSFLKYMGIGATTALAAPPSTSAQTRKQGSKQTSPAKRYKEWIAARVARLISKDHIDAFLNSAPNNQWAQFDPELGYVLKDSIQRDGMDGSHCIYRFNPGGERKTINFADRACRINTYGNSFTQCHQVNDGETWQEYLAAHLGEPIRNLGVGGHGVFQAYRRMLRVENSDARAENIVLNIWGDDHHRSVTPWRGLLINYMGHEQMFHGSPWSYLKVNLQSGQFEEAPNPCPTPESLYRLQSADYVYDTFGRHPVIQLTAMREGVSDVEQGTIRKLADWAGYRFDFSDGASRASSAKTLWDIVAYRSTLHLLEQFKSFAEANRKNLLVLLTHGGGRVAHFASGGSKNEYDRSVIECLQKHKIPYVDSLDKHRDDFQQFRITPQEYVDRYYIGHYNPMGNHFLAYAIKDAVVDWLNPKPITYRDKASIMEFNDG